MPLKKIAAKLQEISREQVVVRARQFLVTGGTWTTKRSIPGGEISQCGTEYLAVNEIQAIVCRERTHTERGDIPGFIWLRYIDPVSYARSFDYQSLRKLRSVVWTGEKEVAEAWRLICESWVEVPNWLSTKPIVFSRQYQHDEHYVDASITDVSFLRDLDHLALQTHQHQLYYENRMNKIAKETPLEKRRDVYRAHLEVSRIRRNMIGVIERRLTTLANNSFDGLAASLGIVPVKSLNLFTDQ